MDASTYARLRLRKDDEIRLFILHPARDAKSKLEGSLKVISLESRGRKKEYEALSYTWNAPFLTSTPGAFSSGSINLDNTAQTIGGNLYDALKHLSHPSTKRTLWIDAICINQSDDVEKSKQVALMSRIYRSAVGVLVWLGRDSSHRDGEFIFGWDEAMSTKKMWTSNGWVKEEDYVARLRSYIQVQEYLVDLFCSRLYFGRRWVVQEICFARYITCCCGIHRTTWEALLHNLRKIGGSRSREFFLTIDKLKQGVAGSTSDPNDWIEHLQSLSQLDCSNTHDRLYALMRVIGANDVPLDYTTPWHLAYSRFAAKCLQWGSQSSRNKNVGNMVDRILAVAAYQKDLQRGILDAGSLPSWVPDWRLSAQFVLHYDKKASIGSVNTTNWTLEVKVWSFGVVKAGLKRRVLGWDRELQLVGVHGRRYPEDPDYTSTAATKVCGGDLLCLPQPLDETMVLRPVGEFPHTYRIAGVCSLRAFNLHRDVETYEAEVTIV